MAHRCAENEAYQQALVQRGLQKYYEKSNRYRPTLKGALWWGAQAAWPVWWTACVLLSLRARLPMRCLGVGARDIG